MPRITVITKPTVTVDTSAMEMDVTLLPIASAQVGFPFTHVRGKITQMRG
jgi:hypothetical protein